MKQARFGTLKGLEVAVNVYESYTEADQAAGKADAMLAEGNASLAYRGPLGEGREILCEMLEEKTGIERKTSDTGKKDKDGNAILKYDESEGEYATRVCNEKGWDDLKAFQGDFDSAVAASNNGTGLSVDIKRPERKAVGPKKLANKYFEKATAIIKNGNEEKFLNKFAEVVGKTVTFTPVGDEKKDGETLGWLCKEYTDTIAAQALNEAV